MNTRRVVFSAGIYSTLVFAGTSGAQEAPIGPDMFIGKCVALSSSSNYNASEDLPATMYVLFDSTTRKEKDREVREASIAIPSAIKPSSKLRSFAKKSWWMIDDSTVSVTLNGGNYTLEYDFPLTESGGVWMGRFSPENSKPRKVAMSVSSQPGLIGRSGRGGGGGGGGGGTTISPANGARGGGMGAMGRRGSDARMGFIPCENMTVLPR